MTQAEFLQQAWDVVWMPADNSAHLFSVSLGFLVGFEEAPAHCLEYRTIQGFLVEERIAIRFQRAFQIFNAYDPARTQQDRSEERRVGKECRDRWSRCRYKKKR